MEDSTAVPLQFSHLSGCSLREPRTRFDAELHLPCGQLYTCIRAEIVALRSITQTAVGVCVIEM
jgi:hypothetical protein